MPPTSSASGIPTTSGPASQAFLPNTLPVSEEGLHSQLFRMALDESIEDETVGWSQRAASTGPQTTMPSSFMRLSIPPMASLRALPSISQETDRTDLNRSLTTLDQIRSRVDHLINASKYARVGNHLVPRHGEEPFLLQDQLDKLSSLAQALDSVLTRGDDGVATSKSFLGASIQEEQAELVQDRKAWFAGANALDTSVPYDVDNGTHLCSGASTQLKTLNMQRYMERRG
jgi:hypothetical protein